MGELYKLNFHNGKSYIGIAFHGARKRLSAHRRAAIKSPRALYTAWRKYGEPSMEVLAIIENFMLCEAEVLAIAVYKTRFPNGYNLTDGGDGTTGMKHSLATRAMLSEKNRNMSAETRNKIRIANTGRYVSNETRQKHRERMRTLVQSTDYKAKIVAAGLLRRGRPVLPSTRKKISAALENPSSLTREKRSIAMRGRKHSEESIQKMRDAHKGKILSEQHKAKIRKACNSADVLARLSAAAIGRVVSDETKAKIAASSRGRTHSVEARMKISQSRKGMSYGPHTEQTKAKMREAHKRRNNKTLHGGYSK